MTLNKKIRILISVVAFLLALNLATWVTMYYHKLQAEQRQADLEMAIVTGSDRASVLNGRFFRRELGFDDEQMSAYRQANKAFRMLANPLLYEIDSLKQELFVELNKPAPDTAQSSRLALHIGEHHSQLKLATNKLYLDLLAIVKPEQREALRVAFLPLFEDRANRNEALLYRSRHQGKGRMMKSNRPKNNPIESK